MPLGSTPTNLISLGRLKRKGFELEMFK